METSQNSKRSLQIQARSTATTACCPNCSQKSSALHGWHHREPQDLPCIGQRVRLQLQVRRFRCLYVACPQKTFVETFSDWLPAYARRTIRLTKLVREVGFETSGEAAKRILNHCRVTISGDTVLRVIRQTPMATSTDPRVIGIDDWAMKKGCRYGTIIIDLEKHQAIEVLPERNAEIVKAWLQTHPSVEIVSRDRSTEYAAGIRMGAPRAVQVADRWHLLLNMRQMVERWIKAIYPQLRKLPASAVYRAAFTPRRRAFRRPKIERDASQASRERRLARYERIQQLRQAGYNILQITRMLDLNRSTIRKYFYASEFPERKSHSVRRSILDPYLLYLEKRHRQGCENASLLWREIQSLGFSGSKRQVSRWMQQCRTHTSPNTPQQYRSTSSQNIPLPSKSHLLPSAKQIAWVFVQVPEELTQEELILLKHLGQHSDVGQVYSLAQTFTVMVKQGLIDQLDSWLRMCATTSIAQVQHFSIGIRQDYAAVQAALELPWSNGQTEGQVNRLKFIKRQMYGRAHFDLLRLRVLYTSGFT